MSVGSKHDATEPSSDRASRAVDLDAAAAPSSQASEPAHDSSDERWSSEDFTEFFEVAYPEAFRLARRMGLESHDAEDVAIEALARTYASWPRLRTLSWSRPWLTRVVANLAIDIYRRRRPRLPETSETSFEGRSVAGMDLSRALAKLPRRQRQVAVMRYLADLSTEEVGAALRLRPGSVKQHAARALRALRAELDQTNGDA
jgi:RNA polymerase sigma factor (sigma-70 family)